MPTDTPDPAKTPLVITGLEIGQDGHEILRIKNITANSIALTGYSLYNPTTKKHFTFPPGFMLLPGEIAEVHSGVSESAVKDGLFWQEEPAWAEAGGDALLLTPTSALAYWYVYTK